MVRMFAWLFILAEFLCGLVYGSTCFQTLSGAPFTFTEKVQGVSTLVWFLYTAIALVGITDTEGMWHTEYDNQNLISLLALTLLAAGSPVLSNWVSQGRLPSNPLYLAADIVLRGAIPLFLFVYAFLQRSGGVE